MIRIMLIAATTLYVLDMALLAAGVPLAPAAVRFGFSLTCMTGRDPALLPGAAVPGPIDRIAAAAAAAAGTGVALSAESLTRLLALVAAVPKLAGNNKLESSWPGPEFEPI